MVAAFCPVSLPEEEVPESHKSCKDCGLYKHGSRMVWGEGNPNAEIMLILDNPGLREDSKGKEFVCGTRETLQKAISDVGMDIERFYMTYILKRKPTRSYDKEKTRDICMYTHLNKQLIRKQPTFIICLGNVAVQSFFQKTTVDVKSLRGTTHTIQGFPTTVSYHPLAIRRRPNLLPSFMEDWKYIAASVPLD